MKNTIKIGKELFKKLKEAWKVPRKKAGIKLLLYFIFLLIFFLIAAIGNSMKSERMVSNKTTTTTTTTEARETLTYKQKELLNNNYNIKYEIKIDENSYVINGTLKSGNLEGYLEEAGGIKKVALVDGVLSETNNGLVVALKTNIISNLIDVRYIINLINDNRPYIENKDGIKTYKYVLNIDEKDYTFMFFCDNNKINKITISNINSEYTLNFDK